MGVSGWNRLMAEEGWLPKHNHGTSSSSSSSSSKQQSSSSSTTTTNCCSTSIWMDSSALPNDRSCHPRLAERWVRIPPGSELHIDGYGLCFHLYSVAYARHLDQVLGQQQQGGTTTRRPCALVLQQSASSCSALTPTQARHLLPTFVPLKLLNEVTVEFVRALQPGCHNPNTGTTATTRMQLIVYWDGRDRRYAYKATTDQNRRAVVTDQWSEYQQYCLYGRLPVVRTLCDWERTAWPKPGLFATQVMHTLQTMSSNNNNSSMRQVFCPGEADHALGRAVTGRPNAYLVGNDSDFCFFPDCNYVPITTLDVRSNSGVVTACVLRRGAIAKSLNMSWARDNVDDDDDDSGEILVELAILMGNDYIDPFTAPLDNDWPGRGRDQPRRYSIVTDEVIQFLRDQGPGYRVTSSDPDTAEALRFVRQLYSLQGDLTEFDLEQEMKVQVEKSDARVLPHLDRDAIDYSLAKLRPLVDTSVKTAVVRCLQDYVDRGARSNMTQDQLDTFRTMTVDDQKTMSEMDRDWELDPTWRPVWEDVIAVRLLESTIRESIRLSLKSPVARLCPPYSFFNQYQYHALRYQQRKRANHSLVPPTVLHAGTIAESEKENAPENPRTIRAVEQRPALPVDEFEDTILKSVKANRVTIVQGETGCGKSSRIPVFLLKAYPKSKLFISQPRRIAAKALVERLRAVEPDFRDEIALRMGHGVREYENQQSRAWFVTTGYLVRLLANHPERFDQVGFLIIDEVHERSVDTDILCLLTRRLLRTNPNIRLILMSATLASAMYQDYFNVSEPVIKVGARRFPVEEVYLDDLHLKVTLPGREKNNVLELLKECRTLKCTRPPSMRYMEKLYSVVAHLATVVGQPGTAVLVFVPGMNEIVAITELVEQMYTAGITYTCFPIHSDIPFEDQMHVFDSAKPNEVKIVVATNAAESSVTLPDVDHVICLGLCKQIVYNEASHRQMLSPTWISKASATQRAGRTGRLRPGTVYRMYAHETFTEHMSEFEPGEMLRIPLDAVILMLKEMLSKEKVREVLSRCLEPPNMKTIDRSFESLFKSHFITRPDDDCEITTLGSFVSALGIDLALGSLIGLGIQFGVGAEAIQLAAILSFPKTPFMMSSPLIHEPEDYNEKTAQTYASRCHFDANLFSDPLAAMNLVWEYRNIDPNKRAGWCRFHGIFPPRIKRLDSTCRNLQTRVADFVGIDKSLLEVSRPPSHLPHAMVTVLRIIQVWVFYDSIIEFDPQSVKTTTTSDSMAITFGKQSDRIERGHLAKILRSERHPYKLEGYCTTEQKGTFTWFSVQPRAQDTADFAQVLKTRLLSYATQERFCMARISFADSVAVFVQAETMASPGIADALRPFGDGESLLVAEFSGTARGLAERACGKWVISSLVGHGSRGIGQKTVSWSLFQSGATKSKKNAIQALDLLSRKNALKSISVHFPWKLAEEPEEPGFVVVLRGVEKGLSDVDLRDLFVSRRVQSSVKASFDHQRIVFPFTLNSPLSFNGKVNTTDLGHSPSWERPLLKGCIPEGARILSVLASGRRRDHIVRLPSFENRGISSCESGAEGPKLLDLHLDPKQTCITRRWKRFNTNSVVFVDTNSVPASCISTTISDILYCCCANTLEVRGGGLKAEALTLLPPGKLFLMLCRLTFGLFKQENVDDGSLTEKVIKFVNSQCSEAEGYLMKNRILSAVAFHFSATQLESKLECFPLMVEQLLSVFHGVDGFDCTIWPELVSNPFLSKNLVRHRSGYASILEKPQKTEKYFSIELQEKAFCPVRSTANGQKNNVDEYCREEAKSSTESKASDEDGVGTCGLLPINQFSRLSSFIDDERKLSERLFDSSPPPGEQLTENDLPSSNIMAIIVHEVRSELSSKCSNRTMSLVDLDWEIYSTKIDGSMWFVAFFVGTEIPYIRRNSKVSAWLKQTDVKKVRPTTSCSAMSCVPPSFASKVKFKLVVLDEDIEVLVFESLELAVRMEAAFWLERQFLQGKRHWYQQPDVSSMANRLKSECRSNSKRTKKGDQKVLKPERIMNKLKKH